MLELLGLQRQQVLSWVPKALQTREAGADIVNISQVYARSGTLQVSFADSGITSPADFAGKTVGNWGFGNEYELFAAIGAEGLDPATDVTLVGQQFDMPQMGDIKTGFRHFHILLEVVCVAGALHQRKNQ